jgi:hypothetical protein
MFNLIKAISGRQEKSFLKKKNFFNLKISSKNRFFRSFLKFSENLAKFKALFSKGLLFSRAKIKMA